MFCDVDNDGIVDENEIIQEDHYYPFGLKHEGYGRNVTQGENFYQYNGKELNQDFGLDMYDYGARWYDASVGRWFAIDPLAEKYVGFSPFNYVANNPIMFIDPDGRSVDGVIVDSDGKILGEDGQKDDKVYVVNNNITKEEMKKIKNFIKENNGNVSAFKERFDYENVTGIESSSKTRQAMVDVVSADDGSGGTKNSVNREYGGSVMKDGSVIPGTPGPVGTPKSGATFNDYQAEDKTRFHSHPSGTITETKVPERDPFGGDVPHGAATVTTTTPYAQAPSPKDISNAGAETRYVFARGENKVYMYNNTGVLATLPHERFVNFKK